MGLRGHGLRTVPVLLISNPSTLIDPLSEILSSLGSSQSTCKNSPVLSVREVGGAGSGGGGGTILASRSKNQIKKPVVITGNINIRDIHGSITGESRNSAYLVRRHSSCSHKLQPWSSWASRVGIVDDSWGCSAASMSFA